MGNVGINIRKVLKVECSEEVKVIRSIKVSVLNDRAGIPSHAPAHTHAHTQEKSHKHTHNQ